MPPKTFVWVGTYEDDLPATLRSKNMLLNLDGQALSFPHVQFVVFTTGPLLIAALIAYTTTKLILESTELIKEHLRIIPPLKDDIIWPLNPLDEDRRQALFQSSLDHGLLFRWEVKVPPQSR